MNEGKYSIEDTNISNCAEPKTLSTEGLAVSNTKGVSFMDKLMNGARAVVGKTTTRNVACRFSINHKAWVEVNPDAVDEVIAVIPTPAYLSNVFFSAEKVTTQIGCGSRTDIAGVAMGDLHSSIPDNAPQFGWENLGFKDKFYTSSNDNMTQAAHLQLSGNRSAKVIE